MDFYQILATIAGFIVVIAGVPQTVRILKTRRAKDVSLGMFMLFLVAQVIWLIYGIHLLDMPIIVSNFGAILVSVVNISLIIVFGGAKKSSR